ncbi:MAG: hypothetical protein QG588_95 [Candidatus Poribacteria bacterium]|nr:hypothetical protein [Candidatus Poribacteria bacterium]
MMAGLHEIRMKRAEKEYDLEALAKKAELFQTIKKMASNTISIISLLKNVDQPFRLERKTNRKLGLQMHI